MSLDTLFKIRPIGVVSNKLNGFLKMRSLIKWYNFSAATTVPIDNDNADVTVEITIPNQKFIK